MANYTITREVESGLSIGCTDFSTIQEEGQIASLGANQPLDATIVWKLEATTFNYVVDTADFSFVGANLSSSDVNQGIYVYKDLPSPILGAVMEQVSSTIIKITFYLAPASVNINGFSFNILGNAFVMPQQDVDVTVQIEGCAQLKGQIQHLVINKPSDTNTVTRVDINEDLAKNLTTTSINDTRDEINGTLFPTKVSGDDENRNETYLMSYQVASADGYRYKTAPNLSFNNSNYYAKRRVTKETSAIDPTRKDITGVSFDIYKKNK